MERAVAVGFRIADPVAQAVGVHLVEVGDFAVDVEANALFIGLVVTFEYDTRRIVVIHLVERYMLRFHLLPNRVVRLDACLELVFQAQSLQALIDGSGESSENLLIMWRVGNDLLLNRLVVFGVLVFETEVFKFGLNGKQSQAMRQGGIDVERFACNLVLLGWWHRLERAHIVQSVGHLDKNHANIVAHSEQQLAEILGLCRSLRTENTAGDFGQTVNNLRNLLAKHRLDVLGGVFRIFHHIVQKCRTNRG